MHKFFITGATGWLGRSLVNSLINGEYCKITSPKNITVLCLPGENIGFLRELGVNIYHGDVRNIEEVKAFLEKAEGAIVMHLCGIIHPKFRTSDFFDINYLGSKHIIQLSHKIGAAKVVLMSSNSPLGCNKSNNIKDSFTEESDFNPYMKYGESKCLMENFANDFISHHDNPKVTIIRAPWFYGPYQPDRQTLFFRLIKEGKFPIVGDGKNKRSMVYTNNLSQGIILSATSNVADGQTYWIADKDCYTMEEILDTVRSVMIREFDIKCKNTSIRLPSMVSDIAYVADSILQKIAIYHQKIHVLSEMNKNIFCSIDKASRDLGYNPSFDLYKGMKNSIGYCLKNGIEF